MEAGDPFTVYCLPWNDSTAGLENVQLRMDGVVVPEKRMAVHGDRWRVIEMQAMLDTAGEHTIAMGTITKSITVSEKIRSYSRAGGTS